MVQLVSPDICSYLYKSNHMSISNHLSVKATRKCFSYPLSLGPNFAPPHSHLPLGDFLSNSNHFICESEGRPPLKNEGDWSNIVWHILLTDTHTKHTQTDTHTHTHKSITINPWRGLVTRNTAGTAEYPTRQQTTWCDIQINIKYCWQLYVECTDVQLFITWHE